MATPNTRFWLNVVTVISAFFAFFAGVFFSVWGGDLSSPPWLLLMDSWHGPRLWGTLYFASGILFLFGLDWERSWPRVLGCAVTGLLYIATGVVLAIAPLYRENALTGSVGMWFLGGILTLCLAGFMHTERRQEVRDAKILASIRKDDPSDSTNS